MSENIWKSLSDRFVPQDTVQLITSAGDFGINCIFSWLPFVVAPSVFTAVLGLVLTLACFGISFSVPTLGASAAKAGGALAYFVLTITVMCTVGISTVALNSSMAMIKFDFDVVDLNLGFMIADGNVVMTYMMIGLAVVLAIVNGLRPFMLHKAEVQSGGKSNLRSVA
jgi:uncharacterized membrane protein YuzA (DUF378 family)